MIGGIIGGIVCICGGIYLASIKAAAVNSIIESLANGIGWYCMGKGICLISQAIQLSRIGNLLENKK
jgi:hypothetical protein